MFRDCAVFFTHVWSPDLARHVERLKRETAGVIDVFVVVHAEPGSPAPDGMSPDFTVSRDGLRTRIPERFRNFAQRGDEAPWGYVDMLWLAAFLDERLQPYDRFWLLEYDVDLQGDWGRFFAAASDYAGDLLTTRLRRLSQDDTWHHADSLVVPATVPDPLIGLFCLSRMTRRLLEAYADAMATPGWDGHFEALIPSFAELNGYAIAEISGEGPWTPPERIDRHYTGNFAARYAFETTWSYRPPHAFSYIASRPPKATPGDTLYHPVKTDIPLGRRLAYIKEEWRWGLKAWLARHLQKQSP